MDRIDFTEDDPSSTSQPPPDVEIIDIRANRELTDHDHRELWLSQYRFKLTFAAQRAHRLRSVVE